MNLTIALAGNPNCGKTTLFNALTGSNQYVGNWPGVTVEKKEGKLKRHPEVTITDLPGVYSLSPYTMEEVVARNYLVGEHPDAILDIVDGTNLERNLYLTTQLIELGIPVVIAVNMMDLVRKRGDEIDIEGLSRAIGCPVIEISALKEEGLKNAADLAIAAAVEGKQAVNHIYSGVVEHALAHIEEAVLHDMPEDRQRWYSIKIFERDPRVLEELKLPRSILDHMEKDIRNAEREKDDDAEAIIINERYLYVSSILEGCYKKKNPDGLTATDRIDRIVTNRVLALPVFVLIMWAVYAVSIGTVGNWLTEFMNGTVFESWVIPAVTQGLSAIGVADWMVSLVADGIVGGVGAVLGFVPQMFLLFLMLSILEDVGYMSRVAFIMDRLFRKFGLSGKSFIPLLVATGCGVPGVMATRTIESDRDRRMTIMTTCFMPCGAKMPMVGLIAGALFGGSAWVATSAYLMGVLAVVLSGLMLKKTKPFSGEPAPFVMELPAYHMPQPKNVWRATWERGWSFVKKAGTVILAASVVIWLLNSLSVAGGLHYIADGEDASILSMIGHGIAVLFRPLGFGTWQAAVATLMGLLAKEGIVSAFGSLSSMDAGAADNAVAIGLQFFGGSRLAAYSFMTFNLLCAPCVAAVGAIRQEMNSFKWTAAAIGYMCGFAYAVSLMIYQFGLICVGGSMTVGTAAAVLLLIGILYLLGRKRGGVHRTTGKEESK